MQTNYFRAQASYTQGGSSSTWRECMLMHKASPLKWKVEHSWALLFRWGCCNSYCSGHVLGRCWKTSQTSMTLVSLQYVELITFGICLHVAFGLAYKYIFRICRKHLQGGLSWPFWLSAFPPSLLWQRYAWLIRHLDFSLGSLSSFSPDAPKSCSSQILAPLPQRERKAGRELWKSHW